MATPPPKPPHKPKPLCPKNILSVSLFVALIGTGVIAWRSPDEKGLALWREMAVIVVSGALGYFNSKEDEQ